MPLMISGSFVLHTPDSAVDYIGRILAKIEFALAREEAGNIHRSFSTITYKRAYAFRGGMALPVNNSHLAQFNPGEISITAKGDRIVVRYRPGLGRVFSGIVLSGICLSLLYFQPGCSSLIPPLAAFSIILFGGCIVYGVLRFRAWLVTTITAAITCDS
jgi:hypothetical protein